MEGGLRVKKCAVHYHCCLKSTAPVVLGLGQGLGLVLYVIVNITGKDTQPHGGKKDRGGSTRQRRIWSVAWE